MRFYIHKLGCPKNDVDSDYMAARLIAAGHEPVSDPVQAESIVVNTCGFILPAREESINEIIRLGQLKKQGDLKTLYAAGCLAQRSGDELLAGLPELDGAFGHGALDSLAQAVTTGNRLSRTVKQEARMLGYLTWKDRFISDPFPYAYLKISDGCDRTCTYCAIPGMRGRFRSRPIDSIVREAAFLAQHGKKELILVSQEATLYGYELPGKPTILTLLQELNHVDGIEWIRLMYQYPAHLREDVIEYLASGTKTLNYFDLPFQHAATATLSRMNRRIDRSGQERLIGQIRSASSDATLRTTFIVGFPGETEAEFDELYDFVQEHQFDRMGVFAYSAEDGTPAALMADQISDDLKHERMDKLQSLQSEIAFAKADVLVGSVQQVLVDEVLPDGSAVGRTRADCPEIDQSVFIPAGVAQTGLMVDIRVTGVDGFDLTGELVEVA